MAFPPGIDPTAIQALRDLQVRGDEEVLIPMVRFYVRMTRERLRDCRQALEEDDTQWLARTAHTLQAASATLGAVRLSQICEEFERCAGRCSHAARAEFVSSLEREFKSVVPRLMELAPEVVR